MKKVIYIFMSLIIISCAKHESKSKATDALEVENIYSSEETTDELTPDLKFTTNESTINEYQLLATQKLNDVYDLINLKQQHPDFKEDIQAQLNALILNSDALPFFNGKVSIENITQKGNIVKVSDSIYKMQLNFNVVSKNKTIKDSINASITTKVEIINGASVKTNKIHFSVID